MGSLLCFQLIWKTDITFLEYGRKSRLYFFISSKKDLYLRFEL